jgi:hypothetical protein
MLGSLLSVKIRKWLKENCEIFVFYGVGAGGGNVNGGRMAFV